eukprot:COSAG01_NODE_18340_length_1083_cov_2.013211_2_plen_241_part_01
MRGAGASHCDGRGSSPDGRASSNNQAPVAPKQHSEGNNSLLILVAEPGIHPSRERSDVKNAAGKVITPGKKTPGYCGVRLDKVGGDYRSKTSSIINFQHKHWFDSVITIRYFEHLKKKFHTPSGKMLGVILDRAPQHESKEMKKYYKANEDWLCIAFIPGGLTSLMQVGDLVCNAELKLDIKDWYANWKMEAQERLEGDLKIKGHVKLKVTREEIIEVGEAAFARFNLKQIKNPTVRNCFT